MRLRSRLGTKDFYKMVLAVAVPMIIQNGLTNFVSLLDNLMIGLVGTNAISGVAIANQLMEFPAAFGHIQQTDEDASEENGCKQ